jgi:hypothetical protein
MRPTRCEEYADCTGMSEAEALIFLTDQYPALKLKSACKDATVLVESHRITSFSDFSLKAPLR